MDWYIGRSEPSQASAVRREVRAYLIRHACSPEGVDDAELIVHEVVANALEHAGGPVWVHVSWLEEEPTLVVWDLGPGFSLPRAEPGSPSATDGRELVPERGRGVLLVTHLASQLVVAARQGGGTRFEARLPVRRERSASLDPPVPVTGALPAMEEAEPEGFGRESFLRALVVQLAQGVEGHVAPDAAAQLVARVGIAIGGQMEAEYRVAKKLAGRLTPAQLAECFVRLKQAIGGGFAISEVTDTRIVLTNSRCPFGNAVRKAPTMCRMTSSVFGGIAAGNHQGGAAVVLEERIAVGDPGCRVVIYLGHPPEGTGAFAHHYQA